MPRSTWTSASARRSRSSTRLGRSVSASCRAMCAICISDRRRSVMSSWVATQPPPAIGTFTTAMVRPSSSSTNWLVVVPALMAAETPSRYWSDVPRKATGSGASFEQRSERKPGADVVRAKTVHLGVARIADEETAVAVEHDEPLRHVGNRRIETHVLRVKVGLARAQLAGALGDQPLEVALDGTDLLDHQRHRAVGPAPIAVECLVGAADETDEAIEVDRSPVGLRLGDLLGKQLVHRRVLRAAGATSMKVTRFRRLVVAEPKVAVRLSGALFIGCPRERSLRSRNCSLMRDV